MSFCTQCGQQIDENARFCPSCGAPVNQEQNNDFSSTSAIECNEPQETAIHSTSTGEMNVDKPKFSTIRKIMGILLCVIFLIVILQSCAVGISNSLSQNGELSGSFGLLSAFSILIAGVVGSVTSKSEKKGGPIVAGLFLWAVFFFSRIGAGSYSDLRIWGLMSFFFGAVYFFSVAKTKKGNIICAVISLVYFILGIA